MAGMLESETEHLLYTVSAVAIGALIIGGGRVFFPKTFADIQDRVVEQLPQSSLPTSDYKDGTITINDVTYQYTSKGVATIDKVGGRYLNVSAVATPPDLVIPDRITVDGTDYPVTMIQAYSLTSTSIGNLVFPDTLTKIPEGLFEGVREITGDKLVIPDSVTSIAQNAFMTQSNNYNGIKTVVLGNGVTEIPSGAFENFDNTTDLKLGNKVRKIDSSAFRNSGLLSLTLPDSVTEVDDQAFTGGLTEVSVKDHNVSLAPSAFHDSTSSQPTITYRN